jgi:predicted metalloprotease
MDIDGRRRSDNFEDRGRGDRAAGAGGLPVQALLALTRFLGLKGTLLVGGVAALGYFVLPSGVKHQLMQALSGSAQSTGAAGAGKVCAATPTNAKACDFSRAVLASTEDVWTARFGKGELPRYGAPAVSRYRPPTLVVFADAVATGGCGDASSAIGPFYCAGDERLYIDPSFYQVMATRLRAPGDFAQAYVIAHEVGHHVQNLIGANRLALRGETRNQTSVRLELQADCLAGVWGHSARASLSITPDDLRAAVNAAHAIGDDTLGHASTADYTHGSSAQRMRWFREGFDSGDPRRCDTFGVARHAEL